MSDEDPKVLARRAIELFSSDSSDRAADIFAAACRIHQQPGPFETVNPSHPSGWKAILETYHERVVASHDRESHRGGTGGAQYLDLADWEAMLQKFDAGFSNARVDLFEQVEQADIVCTRWQISADHTGHYAGAAPTRQRITWTGITMDRFEAGKIAESWFNWDKYSLAKGLGLIRR
ncbi:MAG: ester cyclase [Pseudomonadota bacterium]